MLYGNFSEWNFNCSLFFFLPSHKLYISNGFIPKILELLCPYVSLKFVNPMETKCLNLKKVASKWVPKHNYTCTFCAYCQTQVIWCIVCICYWWVLQVYFRSCEHVGDGISYLRAHRWHCMKSASTKLHVYMEASLRSHWKSGPIKKKISCLSYFL